LVALLTFAGASPAENPTTQPAPIRLLGIDGKSYEPLALAGARAAVIVFVLQDCPICNGYAPQIQRLASRFGPKGTRFHLVQVDPALTLEAARKHAEAYGYSIPVLLDTRHELVGRLGINTAPTAIVLGPDGNVVYQGRIDDQYAAIGKPRTVASHYDLRDAIAATLKGKPVRDRQTRVVGCAVPDLPSPK
jgi:protein-disulfide isomerase